MKKYFIQALVAVCCIWAVDAYAKIIIEPPPDVPPGINSRDFKELTAARETLLKQFNETQQKIDKQAENCRNVNVEEDSDKAEGCIAEAEKIVKPAVREYRTTLKAFKTAVTLASTSSKKCGDIEQQLERDQEAMRRQQKSIEQGQTELAEWAKRNDEAQKAALKQAKNFLVNSLTEKLGEISEVKLAKLEANIKKRAPMGETWKRKIEKIREFEATQARLKGAIDGIALANFGGTAIDGYNDTKEWAAKNGKDAETLDEIVANWHSDPELRDILLDSGINITAAGLGLFKKLAPFGRVMDFGEFIAQYGYSATEWTLSKNRIEEQIVNSEQDLKAVEALRKQIERTVAKLKACKGE